MYIFSIAGYKTNNPDIENLKHVWYIVLIQYIEKLLNLGSSQAHRDFWG